MFELPYVKNVDEFNTFNQIYFYSMNQDYGQLLTTH